MQNTVTIPAEHANDFRAALINLVRFDGEQLADERPDLRRPAHIRQLTASCALLEQAGVTGDGQIELHGDDADTVAYAFESMAQEVVGPQLADELATNPIDVEALQRLIGRLSWSIDQAARFHKAT